MEASGEKEHEASPPLPAPNHAPAGCAPEPGEPIIDPATGDILGHADERLVGRLRITEVKERFAIAEIITGNDLRVGQSCRRVIQPTDKEPTR